MLIHKYNPKWAKDFNQIKRVLLSRFAKRDVSIEHIGSTSVPNLAAKPIIDLDIIYDLDVDFDTIKQNLKKIGYYHNGDQGIPEREVFKRDSAINNHSVLDAIVHHLYVCPTGSKELERHILFRDFLIANQDARSKYQKLKHEIAREAGQDKMKYAQLKEVRAKSFVNSIIEKARRTKAQDPT